MSFSELLPAGLTSSLLTFPARAKFSVLVFVLVSTGTLSAQQKTDFTEALNVARVSAPLTPEERTLAVGLAGETLKTSGLLSPKRMYLAESRVSRDTALEMKGVFERRAMLTYYRYEGDLTIQLLIDLSRRRVMAVKQLPHFFAPISTEESELAKAMAINHPQLNAALRSAGATLVVEVLTVRATLPKDPLFRHRVVRLLFRSGSTYLIRQFQVLVDLTTEKVIVEPVSQMPSM